MVGKGIWRGEDGAGRPKVELSLACWGRERKPHRRGRESRSSVWKLCVGTVRVQAGVVCQSWRIVGRCVCVCVCVCGLRKIRLFSVCAALIQIGPLSGGGMCTACQNRGS